MYFRFDHRPSFSQKWTFSSISDSMKNKVIRKYLRKVYSIISNTRQGQWGSTTNIITLLTLRKDVPSRTWDEKQ